METNGRENKREWVDTDSLHYTKWNPKARTTPRSIEPLVKSMKDYGFLIEFPIKIGGDGEIGDGNRRLASAKLLGLSKVYVEYSDLTSEEIYSFNELMLPHGGLARLQAYVLGYMGFSDKSMTQIIRLEDLVGRDGLKKLAELGYGPGIRKEGRAVAAVVGEERNPEFLAKSIWWLVDLNQQKAFRFFQEVGGDPAVLRIAVETHEPLRRSPVTFYVGGDSS